VTCNKVHLSSNKPRVLQLLQRSMLRCMIVPVGTFAGLFAPCYSSRPGSITWTGRSSGLLAALLQKTFGWSEIQYGNIVQMFF
jgi:hypothetical protein